MNLCSYKPSISRVLMENMFTSVFLSTQSYSLLQAMESLILMHLNLLPEKTIQNVWTRSNTTSVLGGPTLGVSAVINGFLKCWDSQMCNGKWYVVVDKTCVDAVAMEQKPRIHTCYFFENKTEKIYIFVNRYIIFFFYDILALNQCFSCSL